MSELLLAGAGGLMREVLALVRAGDEFDVVGILDDDEEKWGTEIEGAHVLGSLTDALRYPNARLTICIGSGAVRQRAVQRLRDAHFPVERYATVIDPSVRILEGCTVGAGSILLPNVTLTANVTLGSHVVAMPATTFTHDNVIEDFATFASGACLGGGAHIGKAAYLGMNSSIRQGVSVGAGAVIGMGAAVLRDVPAGETWVGVPAKKIHGGLLSLPNYVTTESEAS